LAIVVAVAGIAATVLSADRLGEGRNHPRPPAGGLQDHHRHDDYRRWDVYAGDGDRPARRRASEVRIAYGNIVGSNIYNILFIPRVTALAEPVALRP
jgi:hypothetical protein